MSEAQLFFNSEDQAQQIEIFVANPDAVVSLQGPIEQAAARPGYTVTWQQQNASFFSALQVERNVMFIILTLIVAVAAFNLVSTLVMTVTDKRADIAILRTLGASPASITARGPALRGGKPSKQKRSTGRPETARVSRTAAAARTSAASAVRKRRTMS